MKHLALLLALAACDSPTVAAAPACTTPAPDTWKPFALPSGARGGATFVAGNQLWVATTDAKGANGYSRFDPCTNAWTFSPETAAISDALAGSSVVVTDGKLFIVKSPFEAAASAPISDAAWKAIQPSLVLDGIHVWTGRELLVWHGVRSAPAPQLAGIRIDPARGTVRAIDAKGAPPARSSAMHVWTGDRWLVWGGRTPDGKKLLGDGAQYDPATDRWTPVTATGAPSARDWSSIGWTGSRVFVFGGISPAPAGERGPLLSDGALYDPRADRWEAIPTDKSIFGVRGASMALAGPHLLGFDAHASAIYDPASRAWTMIPKALLDLQPLPVTGAPWPMAVVSDHTGYLLVRFDPASKTWQKAKLPAAAAASFVPGGIAAWVGDRLVISWPAYFRANKSGGGVPVDAGGFVGVPRWTP